MNDANNSNKPTGFQVTVVVILLMGFAALWLELNQVVNYLEFIAETMLMQ